MRRPERETFPSTDEHKYDLVDTSISRMLSSRMPNYLKPFVSQVRIKTDNESSTTKYSFRILIKDRGYTLELGRQGKTGGGVRRVIAQPSHIRYEGNENGATLKEFCDVLSKPDRLDIEVELDFPARS